MQAYYLYCVQNKTKQKKTLETASVHAFQKEVRHPCVYMLVTQPVSDSLRPHRL